jgi:hypothetical protein
MFVLPRRLVVGDVSVILPAAASYAGGAARTPRYVAAAQDASKQRAYPQVSSALPFVLMVVEFFKSLMVPPLTLLRSLSDHAGQGLGPLSGRLYLAGAPRARRRPVLGQCVPGTFRPARS